MGRAGLLIVAMVASCSFDWAAFDPREARTEGGAPGSGGETSAPSSGGSGGATSAGGDGGAMTMGGGGAGGDAGSGGAAGVGGIGGIGGAGGSPIVTNSYAASIAECVDPLVLDPDACEADAGAGHLNVDLEDGPNNSPVYSFLAFPIDGAIAGHTVIDVELALTVSSELGSNSSSSGEIWRVTAFALSDLSSAVPTQIGNQPLAGDAGTVALSRTVTFNLPPSSVAANTTLYVGIYPLSTNGVNYFNNTGATPPLLSITHQ